MTAQERIAAAQQRRAAQEAQQAQDTAATEEHQRAVAIQAFQCQLQEWLGSEYDGFITDFGCTIQISGTAVVWMEWMYNGVCMWVSVSEHGGVPFLILHAGDNPRTSRTQDIRVADGGVHDALACAIPAIWQDYMSPSIKLPGARP